MKKIVKQITGTQIGITFNQDDQKIHDIELGSVIDLSDMVVENKKDDKK